MTAETFLKALLAQVAYREGAHHGGIDNMLAIAFVVRNRVRAGWHGGDWLLNLQHMADVAACTYPDAIPDLRQMQFRMVLAKLEDIFSGMEPDKYTQGALYYCELNRVGHEWFIANILRQPEQHPRIAQVGNVSFFA